MLLTRKPLRGGVMEYDHCEERSRHGSKVAEGKLGAQALKTHSVSKW